MAHIFIIFLLLGAASNVSPAEARGAGRFLGSLLARGAVSVAAHSGTTSYAKSYSPDVLTVAQVAQCIRKAGKLDSDAERLEVVRTTVRSAVSGVDQSASALENQRARLDRSSKASVQAFNAAVDRHNKLIADAKARQTEFNSSIDGHNVEAETYNLECARKYYADDLSEAQKLAETN
jgi:hypothetical protein